MFLLVPAYPCSPGQKAVKRLCVCVCQLLATLARKMANCFVFVGLFLLRLSNCLTFDFLHVCVL